MATVIDEPKSAVSPDFLDDEEFFEIIDGRRVEIPPMSAYAGRVASRLTGEMNTLLVNQPLGEVVVETLFDLGLPGGQNRRPDVAFVSFQRWPKGRRQPLEADAWSVVPNLGIEIVSPHNYVEELLEKIADYFRAGVEQVWVVYPRLQLVHVYESWTRIHVRTDKDELEGGTILPGFRLAVSSLFPEPSNNHA
jgi:Uma2 family endonuclease